MRSVVFRFQELEKLDVLLSDAEDEHMLPLPRDEEIAEGEWVLAIFETGLGRRATAAAARGARTDIGTRLAFEPRDFERLRDFVRASQRADGGAKEAVRGPSTLPPDTARSPVPLAAPAEPGTASHYDSGKFPARIGAGAQVLLVDDDPGIREVVGAMLEAVGLVVQTCSSAEDALQEAATADIDLLVVDWNLPGMSGLELCRAVRKSPHIATIPVLFLSANASSQDMVEAFASGADDYVVKPFRAPELGARIFGLLRRSRMAGHGPVRVRT